MYVYIYLIFNLHYLWLTSNLNLENWFIFYIILFFILIFKWILIKTQPAFFLQSFFYFSNLPPVYFLRLRIKMTDLKSDEKQKQVPI